MSFVDIWNGDELSDSCGISVDILLDLHELTLGVFKR